MKIFAEVGLNHCGDEQRCASIVSGLLESEIDGITFQIREAHFYDGTHPRKKELSDDFYEEMASLIRSAGKAIGYAITRPEKVEVLSSDFWKSLSWDLSNFEFVNQLTETGKPVYVSTGLSSTEQIVSTSSLISGLEFIHTQLDDKIEGVNLRAIDTIRKSTGRPCGFGLHCDQLEVLYSAVSFSPSNLFFYVKDETGLENPDDLWAVPLSKVVEVSRTARKLSFAIGDGKKTEIENKLHPSDDKITQNLK